MEHEILLPARQSNIPISDKGNSVYEVDLNKLIPKDCIKIRTRHHCG